MPPRSSRFAFSRPAHNKSLAHSGRSVERIAENQVLFRDANENISTAAERHHFNGQPVPFLCECPSEQCVEVVPLPLATYATIRSNPRVFFVVAGHEREPVAAGADVVVGALGDHVVLLEKVGAAAEIAQDQARSA